MSNIEAEVGDVAVPHDVVLLALDSEETPLVGCGELAVVHERVEGDDLRADEASLRVVLSLAGPRTGSQSMPPIVSPAPFAILTPLLPSTGRQEL